jgi:hypothetical protein
MLPVVARAPVVGSQEDQCATAPLPQAVQGGEQFADEVVGRAERPQITDIVAAVGILVRFSKPHEEEGRPHPVQISKSERCRIAIRTEPVRAGVRVGERAALEHVMELGIAREEGCAMNVGAPG